MEKGLGSLLGAGLIGLRVAREGGGGVRGNRGTERKLGGGIHSYVETCVCVLLCVFLKIHLYVCMYV